MINKGYTIKTLKAMSKLTNEPFKVSDLPSEANSGMLLRMIHYGLVKKVNHATYQIIGNPVDLPNQYAAEANKRKQHHRGVSESHSFQGPRIRITPYGDGDTEEVLIQIGKRLYVAYEVGLVAKKRRKEGGD